MIDYGQQVLAGLRALSDAERADRPRDAIGLSEVGKCVRRLWYQAHGYGKAEDTALDTAMLFEIGHQVEASIIKGLRAAGVIVIDRAPDGGQLTVNVGGIEGHIDGLILEPIPGAPNQLHPSFIQGAIEAGFVDLTKPIPGYRRLLLECKTVSEYGYKGLAANGLELSYFDYWLQVQSYATGLELDGIVFIAVNKGGGGKDRKGIQKQIMYQEQLRVNPAIVKTHMARLLPILQAETVPARPYEKPTEFACMYCPFRATCWEGEV